MHLKTKISAQHMWNRRVSVFIIIWFGQLVSLVGSGLASFAIGIWVYQQTGSVTNFALINLFTFLPSIVLLPFVGVLVDRWNRRQAMLVSDAGAGCCTIALALLLFTGQPSIWPIYFVVAASSTFNAFHWTAYMAAIPLLVPKAHLGRANGMVQLGHAISQLMAPLLAGILVGVIQVQGVVLIDFTTFLFAFATLLLVRIPKPKSTPASPVGDRPLLREISSGWTYIRTRSGLLGLLIFYSITNFTLGIVEVLFTPLVLSFASAAILGMILSIGGSGMLLGSVVMSAWQGAKRRIMCVFSFTLLQGIVLSISGLRPSASLLAAAAFVFLFSTPLIMASSQAIWHSQVPSDLQGRVFAIQRTVGLSSLPVAYLLAGPLADRIFEPLLTAHGPLSNSIGRIIGVGPGRGIALLFIILGGCNVLIATIGYLYPPLRCVEEN